MKRITVFCGSSYGNDPDFEFQAKELGKQLAQENIALVYGGASTGLMGTLADGALAHSGTVLGVLPNFLKSKEIAHPGLSQMIWVDTMHERKHKMNELCDGVIALPGGFGTLEELFEMLTWGQLGLHKKPIGILNINGFFDELLQFMDTMVHKGLLKEDNRNMVLERTAIPDLLTAMKSYQPPTVGKWITRENM